MQNEIYEYTDSNGNYSFFTDFDSYIAFVKADIAEVNSELDKTLELIKETKRLMAINKQLRG